jgi:hypothetical protein
MNVSLKRLTTSNSKAFNSDLINELWVVGRQSLKLKDILNEFSEGHYEKRLVDEFKVVLQKADNFDFDILKKISKEIRMSLLFILGNEAPEKIAKASFDFLKGEEDLNHKSHILASAAFSRSDVAGNYSIESILDIDNLYAQQTAIDYILRNCEKSNPSHEVQSNRAYWAIGMIAEKWKSHFDHATQVEALAYAGRFGKKETVYSVLDSVKELEKKRDIRYVLSSALLNQSSNVKKAVEARARELKIQFIDCQQLLLYKEPSKKEFDRYVPKTSEKGRIN